jgi:microcystin-dependent protein
MFTWGTIAAVSPLRLLLDGDTEPLPIAPELLVPQASLALGDRVRCELAERRVIVHGRAGGAGAGHTFPVGVIIDWPSESPTPGYALDCDGRAVSRTVYSSLFGTIGTDYGSGDGSTTFNVPDLRMASLPTSARLIKTNAGTTSGTPGAGIDVVWSSDTFNSGMWSSGSGSRVYPNRMGKWRVRAKIYGAAAPNTMYATLQKNGLANAISEGRDLNASNGPGVIAEDVFEVTSPGSDYFTVTIYSTLSAHPLTVNYSLLEVDYLGPIEEYAPDARMRKVIVATDRGPGVTVVQGQGQFLGQIIGWPGHAGAPIPATCLELNGQSVSASTYSGLAALFPGWVSGSNLVLPDLRGRALVGHQPGDATFGTLGGRTGAKTHTLTVAEMPSHDHPYGRRTTGAGTTSTGTGIPPHNSVPSGASDHDAGPTAAIGGGGAHNNVQPSYVGRWLVVAADSAGEYNPTVQAALTARLSTVESPPFGRIRLGAAAGPSIPSSIHTDVTAFRTVDAMYGMSQSSGRITIVRAGWYELRLSVAFAANAVGDRLVAIRKNGSGPLDTGSMIAYGPPLKGTSSVHGIAVTAVRHHLEEGDVLTPNVWQGSGASLALIDETASAYAGPMNFLEVEFIRA